MVLVVSGSLSSEGPCQVERPPPGLMARERAMEKGKAGNISTARGWLSKLWSSFGSPRCLSYYTKDLTRDDVFDNHPRTSNPQLPSKVPQIATIRGHKALLKVHWGVYSANKLVYNLCLSGVGSPPVSGCTSLFRGPRKSPSFEAMLFFQVGAPKDHMKMLQTSVSGFPLYWL